MGRGRDRRERRDGREQRRKRRRRAGGPARRGSGRPGRSRSRPARRPLPRRPAGRCRPGHGGTGPSAGPSSRRSPTPSGCGCSWRRCGSPSGPAWTARSPAASWPPGSPRSWSPRCASRRPAAPGRRRRGGRLPELIAARGERRAVVGMLTGCVQQVFFPDVNAATARVLAAEGCDVIVARDQGCCGALSLHGGRRAQAAQFARRTIEAFERAGVDTIVVNAAGCGSAMKEYGQLLAGDPDWAARAAALSDRVADFSEFLARPGPGRAAAPAAADRGATRTPVTWGTPSGSRGSRASCWPASPGSRWPRSATAGRAAGRPASTTWSSRRPRRSWAPGRLSLCGALAVSSSFRPIRDVPCRSPPRCAAQGTPMPVAHVAQVLDASLRGQASALLSG